MKNDNLTALFDMPSHHQPEIMAKFCKNIQFQSSGIVDTIINEGAKTEKQIQKQILKASFDNEYLRSSVGL